MTFVCESCHCAFIDDIRPDECPACGAHTVRPAQNSESCDEYAIRKGSRIWYVDFDAGEIESGTVFSVFFKNGKLDSFTVDFDCEDFDEFSGSTLGKSFFLSEKSANDALLRGPEGSKIEVSRGCECCAGDQALYWSGEENNAFIDSKGEIMATANGQVLRFRAKFCPNCGRRFGQE